MKKNLDTIRLAGLLFCLTPVAAAVAQTAEPAAVAQSNKAQVVAQAPVAEAEDAYRVVVTGARSEMRQKDTAQRIEVVTRKDIAQTPHRELADLLDKNTNVQIKQYPGMSSAIAMRGFTPTSPMTGESMQTLVLQNGIPLINNEMSFASTQGLARVEVLRGPSSSLYGSQAMAGVINLIPVRRSGDLQGGIGVGYGSFNTREIQADIGGAISPWLNMDYFGSWRKQGDFKSGDGTRWSNSGSTQYSHALRFGFELAEGWSLDTRADLFRGDDVQNPGSGGMYKTTKDVKRDLYSATLKGRTGQHALSASAYSGKEAYTTKDLVNGAEPLSFDSSMKWSGIQLKDEWNWGEGYQLVYGLDHNTTKASSMTYVGYLPHLTPSYGNPGRFNPDNKLQTTGVYAQQSMRFNKDRTNIYVGGRYDRLKLSTHATSYLPDAVLSSRSFSQFSPSVGIKHYFTPMVAMHATIGKGFAAPSAWKLGGEYTTSLGTYIGNPNLRPESSRSADIGVSLERESWNADLTYYDTRVKDKIIYDYTRPDFKITWKNAKARMKGLELSAGWNMNSNLALNFGYTHSLRAESEEAGVWKDLEYVPKNTARLSLDGKWNDFSGRIGARYTGEATKKKMKRAGYALWDVSVAYRFRPSHTVSLSVDNLFDKHYEDVVGYPMPGRAIKVGYRWDFK